MSATVGPQKQQAAPESPQPSLPQTLQLSPAARKYEGWNFFIAAAYLVVMRTGWIFKTESIVMPAVLDLIGGSAWLRGCLPLINRFGHSIPPLLANRRLKNLPRKKWAAVTFTTLMSLSFLSLASMWVFARGAIAWWMPYVFLVCYSLFFISTGLNQLSVNTLSGKLIQADRRGRLLLVATVVGVSTAIFCAWFLLGRWLSAENGEFRLIFGFAGMMFGVGAVLIALLVEPRDRYYEPVATVGQLFLDARRTLAADANFRLLGLITALFGFSIMLFPHYQALARQHLDRPLTDIVIWVIVQNLGTAAYSLFAGPVADISGNRRVVRISLFAVAVPPLIAVALARLGLAGGSLYYFVFVMIGVTPITIKTLQNYTLEIAPPAEHPRYLSTLSLCLAAPMFLSPIVGLAIDWIGFDVVFMAIAAILLCGAALSFGLNEPRHSFSQVKRAARV